tara:strand:- start:509 stop:730 length:222 start_codon:yes stop_codon:yes gene_type:complete
MRNTPLRAYAKKSPVYKKGEFDFSKKADYSKEKLKGNIGSKIAKAVIPTSLLDVVPIGKAAKLAKVAYKYFTG